MLTRKQAGIAAFLFAALFVISLTLNLHGAVAVAAAILFFVFLSASIGDRHKTMILIFRIVGWVFIAIGSMNLLFPTSNRVFAGTLIACGLFLAIRRLSSCMIKRDEENKV